MTYTSGDLVMIELTWIAAQFPPGKTADAPRPKGKQPLWKDPLGMETIDQMLAQAQAHASRAAYGEGANQFFGAGNENGMP